jgi:hypothetical protein
MAVIKKTLFPKNLEKFAVLVDDTQTDSKYFKITELPGTFTGGKNAFLIAGSEFLVTDTKIQIELKDSAGNIIYHEPGEGMINTNISGSTNTSIITEYYEGVSKVVAVYVYPDTAYGPCTLTILGELSEYQDANGVTLPVPLDWENKYNVKWQKQVDVNPSLANTTKIRFYKRPSVTISELLDPIYRIDTGSGVKINTGINQSFASIKISNLETFAGDVKRVKVFRTSLGDISDYDMIQDILVESKELLTTFGLSGSVIGNTGTFTSETLKNFWNTGSLNTQLSNNRIESGVRLSGSGNFIYSASLDLKSANTYELNLDAFYSSSTSSNLGIYLSYVSQSTTFTSSLATLVGTQPTKNLLDTVIPFKIDRDYPSASLYFSQSQGEWHLGNISLRLSQDTAFSPDEISFITTMPTVVGNEDFNFKFEFYDVNNNYVPILVTGSANFTGGSNAITKLLTFESDRTAFRFSTGSFANPPIQFVKFKTTKTNFTGSITYASSAFDISGNYITPISYAGSTYPGTLTNVSDNGALLSIDSFKGQLSSSIMVGSITYTASCEGFEEYETIYRFEDGDNAPGVFVTTNTNQFIYKATDLSLNPTGQVITIEAKRKNLGIANSILTVNSASGTPPLTLVGSEFGINGVNTYTLAGSSYPYSIGERIYYISGSDQFNNEFSDAIKISPVKILDGFSVATSNENTSFPANSVGSVIGGFTASSGSLTVKVGNEVINYSSLFVTNSFSASISTFNGLTPNTFNGTDYSINTLSQDSGSLTLLVKYQDGGGTIISSSKEITYSKVKKAAPVLSFIVGNNNQTATALSTGVQIDEFVTASLSVIETYDGISSTKTLTLPPTTTATNSYTIGNKTTTTIALPKIVTGTDSVDISITGSVIDSENITRNVFGNISLAKAKKSAPVVVALFSSDTQTITKSKVGVYGTPSTFTISVNEGSSSYSYSTGGGINTYQISLTGGTGTTTITPIPPTTDAGTMVNIIITYVNSEGTTGTITKTHKVSVTIDGSDGTNGAVGGDGPGVVFRGPWSSTTTYNSISQDPTRRDVVLYSGTYYATKTNAAANLNKQPNTETTFWQSLGTDSFFVAAEMFISKESYVQNTINVGTNISGNANITIAGGTTSPYISIGQATKGYNNVGAFLGSDGTNGKLSLKSSTNSLLWDGSTLTVNGTINVAGGNAATQTYASDAASTAQSNAISTAAGDATTKANNAQANAISTAANDATTKANSARTAAELFATGIGTNSVASGSASAEAARLSAINQAKADASASVNLLANGGWTATAGTFITANSISSPVIAGNAGYISTIFRVGQNGITLDGDNKKIFVGTGTYNNANTSFYFASGSTDVFSLGNKLTWDGTTLGITGNITVSGGNAATTTQVSTAQTTANNAATAASNAQTTADSKLGAGQAANDVNSNTTSISGGKIRTGIIESTGYTYSSGDYSTTGTQINLDNGLIRSKNFTITSTGDALFKGSIAIGSGNSIFKADTNGIYLGNTTFASAPFSVTPGGSLSATNANLTGNITATGGTLGGWVIDGAILRDAAARLQLNPGSPSMDIFDTSGAKRLTIKFGSLTSPFSAASVYIDPPSVSINPPINNYGIGFHTQTIRSSNYTEFSVSEAGTYFASSYTSNIVYNAISTGFGFQGYVGAVVRSVITDTSGNEITYFGGAYGDTSQAGDSINLTGYNTGVYLSFPVAGTYRSYVEYSYDLYIQLGTAQVNSIAVNDPAVNVAIQLDIAEMTTDGFQVISSADSYCQIRRGSTYAIEARGSMNIKAPSGNFIYLDGLVHPMVGNTNDLGTTGNRWKTVWTNNALNSTSDERLKNSIEDTDLGLDFVNKLRPVKYKNNSASSPRYHYGLIAQELVGTLNDFNKTTSDVGFIASASFQYTEEDIEQWKTRDDWHVFESEISASIKGELGLAYTELISPMIKAIQELTTKVEQLEAKISGSI